MRKHWRYLSYVLRHKAFVLYAGVLIGPPEGSPVLRHLRWWLQLAVHDWSKFLPSEWGPYVERFYGPKPEPYRPALYYSSGGVVRQVEEHEAIPDAMVEKSMDGFSVPHAQGNIGSWTPALVRGMLEREREARVPAPDPAIEAAFRVAWAKHIHRNPHHWQHWLLTLDRPRTGDDAPYQGDAQRARLPMPERYLREMVADWAGAGRAITGRWDVVKWYEEHQGNIKVHGDTRMEVERLLWGFMDEDSRVFREMEIQRDAQWLGASMWEEDS